MKPKQYRAILRRNGHNIIVEEETRTQPELKGNQVYCYDYNKAYYYKYDKADRTRYEAARSDFYEETFFQFITRSTGFGETSWKDFATLQAFIFFLTGLIGAGIQLSKLSYVPPALIEAAPFIAFVLLQSATFWGAYNRFRLIS